MHRILLTVCACISLWGLSAVANAQPTDTIAIHGFKVEYAQIGLDKLQRVQSSLEQQMEIVEQSGVPADVLEFFKSVPLVMVPDLDKKFGFARTRMDDGPPQVEIKIAKLPEDRPILLHELLHAYHSGKLGPTPMIRDSYQQALRSGIYPKRYADAHFLENPREYFAVIGSIFLYGKRIDQPPFDCELPAKYQPQFIEFLAQQFGPHPCK